MNAIVPVPSSALVHVASAPASPPPPPPGGPRGLSFSSVYSDVMMRADDMLPDQVVHVADLKMTPEGTIEEKFALRHRVRFSEGGPFARLFGAAEVMTNSLHGQGIKQPGKRIVIDGWAEDGTPEALFVEGAAGFTLAVQWHPEWNAATDPVSRPLFRAFGEAAARWAVSRQPGTERVRIA